MCDCCRPVASVTPRTQGHGGCESPGWAPVLCVSLWSWHAAFQVRTFISFSIYLALYKESCVLTHRGFPNTSRSLSVVRVILQQWLIPDLSTAWPGAAWGCQHSTSQSHTPHTCALDTCSIWWCWGLSACKDKSRGLGQCLVWGPA